MVSAGPCAYCPRCGAKLRRDQPLGAVCDPCAHLGVQQLPPEFFHPAPVQAALRGYQFGPFLRRVRGYRGWSQNDLGAILDLPQNRISDIENGRALYDIRIIVKLHQRLGIPAPLLGFGDPATVIGGKVTGLHGQKGSWMERRDFVQHAAGLALGIASTAGLVIGRVLALLPQAEPTGTRHVGASDIDVIEELTASFARQDFAHGSGPIRDGAVAQLSTVLPLLDAQASAEVRSRLLVATARLAMMTGWMSFQVRRHADARQLWLVGLEVARDARDAGHPLGSDLTAYLLFDMALQAVHLGRPEEALRLIKIADAVAMGSEPVSAPTKSSLASIQARAYAAQGDIASCDRALGQALEHFARIDQAPRPPWGAHLNDAGIASHQGAARYGLALSSRDALAAGRAAPLLRHAVDNFGPEYAQLQALYLPDLAGAHALGGDVDTAVSVGHQAVDAVTAVSSPRAYDQLRTLNTVLEPLRTSPGVAELRERLVSVAA
jgi:transcriptional regulator with XRE-family HTH domain